MLELLARKKKWHLDDSFERVTLVNAPRIWNQPTGTARNPLKFDPGAHLECRPHFRPLVAWSTEIP